MNTAANAEFLTRLEQGIVQAELAMTRQAEYVSRYVQGDPRNANNQRVLESMQRSLDSLYRARKRVLNVIG
ncbi:hypothetical protein [Paraburkholderia sp. D1E]|uniref:hypothetical protein n=1 Tax=Paraburkholderia sp. D1E TaxID=3461398 RepID=UPI004045D929